MDFNKMAVGQTIVAGADTAKEYSAELKKELQASASMFKKDIEKFQKRFAALEAEAEKMVQKLEKMGDKPVDAELDRAFSKLVSKLGFAMMFDVNQFK